jgi:hypothetical protein
VAIKFLQEIFPPRPTPEKLAQIARRDAFVFATGQVLKNNAVLPADALVRFNNIPDRFVYGYPSLNTAIDDVKARQEATGLPSVNLVDADGGVFPIFEREFFLGIFRRIFGNSTVKSILHVGGDLDQRLLDIAGIEKINQMSKQGNAKFVGVSASWEWLFRQQWLENYFKLNGFEGYVYGINRTDPERRTPEAAWTKMEGLLGQSLQKLNLQPGAEVDMNLFVDVFHPIAPAADKEGKEGLFVASQRHFLEAQGLKVNPFFRMINPFFKPGEFLDNASGQFLPAGGAQEV